MFLQLLAKLSFLLTAESNCEEIKQGKVYLNFKDNRPGNTDVSKYITGDNKRMHVLFSKEEMNTDNILDKEKSFGQPFITFYPDIESYNIEGEKYCLDINVTRLIKLQEHFVCLLIYNRRTGNFDLYKLEASEVKNGLYVDFAIVDYLGKIY